MLVGCHCTVQRPEYQWIGDNVRYQGSYRGCGCKYSLAFHISQLHVTKLNIIELTAWTPVRIMDNSLADLQALANKLGIRTSIGTAEARSEASWACVTAKMAACRACLTSACFDNDPDDGSSQLLMAQLSAVESEFSTLDPGVCEYRDALVKSATSILEFMQTDA